MTDERWLAATWPFVRDQMPSAPASVLELGCGPHGGFVPALRRDGFEAVGVDPQAPDAPGYHRIEFERFELPRPVDAMIACTSLHHVDDLGRVADRAHAGLLPGGVLVVVEWAWERLDEATARWCFARIAPTAAASDPGWLHRRRDEWATSREPWSTYWQAWARKEHLHPAESIVQELDARFNRLSYTEGPYLFPELDDVTEQDEQAAIDTGEARATCIRYVGTPRGENRPGSS
jgi:SAM-dependent methyltransferase